MSAIEWLADALDIVVAFVLLVGVIWSVLKSVAALRGVPESAQMDRTEFVLSQLRLQLGAWLMLALELLIVADLLHSVYARTLEEMVILAITVLTRIALSFILARELEELKTDLASGDPHAAGAAPSTEP